MRLEEMYDWQQHMRDVSYAIILVNLPITSRIYIHEN